MEEKFCRENLSVLADKGVVSRGSESSYHYNR